VVFELKPRAIIAGEDKVGVLVEFKLTKEVGNATDLRVDVLDDIGVGVEGIGIPDLFWKVERNVGHGVGEVEEEGFFFVRFDELERAVGIASGDAALVDGEFDNLFVFDEPLLVGRVSG